MNCREAEKHIYLHAELNAREREEIDLHVTNCVVCHKLLETVSTQRKIIGGLSAVAPELSDASRMTRSIMDAVYKRQRNRAWSKLPTAIPSMQSLRYTLAMISLLLITTFFIEYTREQRLAPYKHMPVARNTELNTASFHAAFIAGKENEKTAKTLFYECVVNCLYTPKGDCEGCKKRITNIN